MHHLNENKDRTFGIDINEFMAISAIRGAQLLGARGILRDPGSPRRDSPAILAKFHGVKNDRTAALNNLVCNKACSSHD